MQLLTADQINRVLEVTDSLGLKRLAVIVPLAAAEVGCETVLPDGNLLISVPRTPRFDFWLQGLAGRLLAMELSRTPRADQLEPPMPRVPELAEGSGMHRYWNWEDARKRALHESVALAAVPLAVPPGAPDVEPLEGMPPEPELVPDFSSVDDVGGES